MRLSRPGFRQRAVSAQEPGRSGGQSEVVRRAGQRTIPRGLRAVPRLVSAAGHVPVIMVLMHRRDELGAVDHRDSPLAGVHHQPVVPGGPADGERRNLRPQSLAEDEIVQAALRVEHGVLLQLPLEQIPAIAGLSKSISSRTGRSHRWPMSRKFGKTRLHLLHRLPRNPA